MARTELTGAQIKDATVSLTADVTGTLPVANGGTGNTTNTLNSVLVGNGTGAITGVAPSTAANVLRSNGTAWASTALVKGDVGLGNVDNTSNSTERAATRTLTNARITKRSLQSSNDTTFDIDTDLYDYAEDTGLTGGVTVTWSGTPTLGQTLWVALTGTASRAITWDTDFEASAAVALPTTTSGTARLDIGFIWNSASSKFRCVAAA